ncbi:MAG: SusE domain-containing protein [Prevotella sp.]|jgi:hypothetical protein
MKAFIKTSALLLCALAVFASCDDDRDNNPTMQSPTTFKLNTPSYTAGTIDLANSTTLNFTWSQPDYGFPAAASYEMQFSPENTWTVSVDEALADESGNTVPTYGSAGGVVTVVNSSVEANDIATLLERCEKWTEDAVPATQTVYARCMAVYAGDTIYSNVISFTVVPYYVELKNADPNYWYLIGACIGDGAWTNTTDALGTSVIPLYPITGQTYDAKTGDGILSWTGYLTTDGFKLVHVLGSWNEQAGSSDGGTTIVWNDGGSSNICVSENGIYTVTLNTTTSELTVEPYTGSASVYSTMYLTGDFDSWGVTNAMSAFSTYDGAENHDWVFNLTIDADGGVKFTSDNSWTYNWGSTEWTYGTGIAGGSNIPAKAGSYKVFFNDITGQYNFIAQ